MRKFFCVIMFLFTSSLFAQYEQLITDRPDQTESASIVPKEHIQIETGVVYQSDEVTVGSTKVINSSLDVATTLFRYGMFDSFEFRVRSQYSIATTEIEISESSRRGINGLTVGGKYKIFEEKDAFPQMGVLLNLNLPVGNEKLIGDAKVSPELMLIAAHSLSENSGLGYNLGAELVNGKSMKWVYTLSYGTSISELVGGFIEIFGEKAEDTDVTLSFDTGLTYLLSNNIQLDGSFGLGLTGLATDWFVNGGIALRLPN